jgi:glycosyltransferase involved in cell wall biosynthesis
MNKKLLFVNQSQFGYHIDFFKYCRYLKTDFDITYICWDYFKPRIEEEGIKVIYVPRVGTIIRRNFRFLIATFRILRDQDFHSIFVNYFRACFIIPLFYKKRSLVHLHIVSGSVSRNSFSRLMYNSILSLESHFFFSVSVISEGLKKLLKVTPFAYILPLGADPLIIDKKLDNELNLLYIGTLSNRHIDDTITGLGLFVSKHREAIIRYIIIGDGWGNELEELREKVREFGLENNVELKGYIPHNDLGPFLERADVGISYIPITPYYEYQPATKTFEYLMAGIPVIATGTYENRKVINDSNGFVINDDPESFASGLEHIYLRQNNYDAKRIRESVADYEWEAIISRLKKDVLNFRKLLLVNQRQFGYHINFYKYCKYLKDEYDITYICWDYGEKRIIENGINVIYVPRTGGLVNRNLRFLKAIAQVSRKNYFLCTMVNYFRGCSVIPFFRNVRMRRVHLNIVSGSVSRRAVFRRMYNSVLLFESRFFRSISVLSEGLKKILKLRSDAIILPLGADPIVINRTVDDKVNLIYIGTLTNRRIRDTITGLGLFIKKNKEVDVHYDILGDGWGNEKEELNAVIRESGLKDNVVMRGYVPHEELKQYLEKADVGISYIPVTPYYEFQPATKTFEYLMSGIPVIATSTYENRKVITEGNGVIIEDNPESFAEGFERLYRNLPQYDPAAIRESVAEYKWENIVARLRECINDLK